MTQSESQIQNLGHENWHTPVKCFILKGVSVFEISLKIWSGLTIQEEYSIIGIHSLRNVSSTNVSQIEMWSTLDQNVASLAVER